MFKTQYFFLIKVPTMKLKNFCKIRFNSLKDDFLNKFTTFKSVCLLNSCDKSERKLTVKIICQYIYLKINLKLKTI